MNKVMTPSNSFTQSAEDLGPMMIDLRRRLHAMPEIGLNLPQTQAAVLDAIAGLNLEVTSGVGLSSVVAVVRGRPTGRAVLLRGDMDALPLVETTGLPYAATNGAMHACGHDMHTAGLVGAAHLLHERRSELDGDVILMFQPGEESPGGAGLMIDEGVLTATGGELVAAYAIHVVPGQRGVFSTRPGTVMAGSNILRIQVHGRGGHGSQPHRALDPVPVLAEIILALQAFVTRRFSVTDPIVLSVTQLDAGTASNVIPETADLVATIRTLSHETFSRVAEEAPRLARRIAEAHGCSADAEFTQLYPVTINDPREAFFATDLLADRFGQQRSQAMPEALMGSEDFSLVLDRVPGAFIMLQASPEHISTENAEFNHSPRVTFDDSVLTDQAEALATLAFERLRVSEARADLAVVSNRQGL